MRQIMQAMVALMVLMSSASQVSAAISRGYEPNDSLTAETTGSEIPANTATRKITGTVYDGATGLPLAGVRVQGTGHVRVTAMTDESGNYTLRIPSYITLLNFNTPQYGLVQRPVSGDDVVDAKLFTDKFAEIYNDNIKVTAENTFDVGITSALSIDEQIGSHLAADVRTITRSGTPGIGAAMFIRGINSLHGNTQPLIIVDGVIYDLQENAGSLHMGFFNNILAGINVADIDNVEVMKNGTALYGARAANGVILITTKRGKSMATRITANVFGSIALTPKFPDLMGAEQYRIYANELIGTMKTYQTQFPFLQSNPDYIYYNNYHNNTNWSDYTYREAFTQNYNVNVEGGDDIAMYNFSLGYADAESTLKGNDFDRLNIRFNSDIALTKNLKTRFDIGYSRVSRALFDDGAPAEYASSPISSPGFLSMIKSPFLSPYRYNAKGQLTKTIDYSDTFAYGIDNTVPYTNNSYYNPLTILTVGEGDHLNSQEYTQFTLSVAPELTLGDFKISEIFNYSLHRMNEKYYLPYPTSDTYSRYYFYAENMGRIGNKIASFFGKEASTTSDTRASWSKVFGASSFNVYGGFRYTSFKFDSNYLSAANSGNDKATQISPNYNYLTSAGDNNQWTNLAWYLNADYSYLTRYFLQGTVSMETSSRFGKEAEGGVKLGGVSWGVFPSLQAAWLVSSEPWFKVNGIDGLKVRAGYDETGNDAIDYYACHSYLQIIRFQNEAMGLQLGNVENQNVKWETTKRYNVGLDAQFLDNRLALSFDYYWATTQNLLVPKTYEYVTGMGTYWSNGGELKNTGFEASVNAKVIAKKDFQWEVGASAGHYKNEVTKLDEAIAPIDVYGGQVITAVGQSIGSFWGYKTNGVLTSDKAANDAELYRLTATGEREYFKAGDMRFVDLTGEGCIDENDKTVIGNPNPDFYGNIFTKVSYKNWQLNVVFNYSLGNDIYNYMRQQLESGNNFFNQTTAMLSRWSYDGQNTNMPRLAYGDPMGNSRFSDRWIEDGSYLRLKTVQLSYDVPVSLSWLQGITVWAAANNLLTFTKYLGSDPETSVSNSVFYQGIDAGLLPQSRSFHLGVKINL